MADARDAELSSRKRSGFSHDIECIFRQGIDASSAGRAFVNGQHESTSARGLPAWMLSHSSRASLVPRTYFSLFGRSADAPGVPVVAI